MQHMDVVIDPFPYGGGITSIDALTVSTPVVTLLTNDLRGAQTGHLYRVMGTASFSCMYVCVCV
jgi:protein O-GlcNAc transferase